MVYLQTVGMDWVCFFIPALWQGATTHANLFFPSLWDATDPELTLGMVNEGHGMAGGGTDGPTATEEINLVVSVDAAAEVERQMEVQQAGVGTRTQDGALFFLSLGAGVVRG